jgi:hypothetical protein
MSFNEHSFQRGQIVQVKVQGEIVDAKYVDWHHEYNMAIVEHGGKRIYRKVWSAAGVQASGGRPAAAPVPVKASKFSIDQRFGFIENLCDMVIAGESRAVIICGSGGLGKTYTVTKRLGAAGLRPVQELLAQAAGDEESEEDNGDEQDETVEKVDERLKNAYEMVKGFTTPKALYRLLYNNRDRIVIFDDCDSVWDNPVCVSLLKAALDSYDTRRLSWLSELRNDDDDLPQSFEFTGQIIFISNLSLNQLDQAVLSRSLYVDVSMTPDEKIQRIKTISKDIKPEWAKKEKDDSIELLSELKDNIGDLNIRTFLKVLEIRHKGADNWRDLAEYVVTAM